MADEADLADAGDGAEREDVLLDFGGQSLSHLHNITLCVILVALSEKYDGVRVLQRNLVLEQPHVIMVSLKAVLHDEEGYANECRDIRLIIRIIITKLLHDFTFADLIRTLHFLDKCAVRIDAVALFKDDWVDLSE